MRWYYSQWRFYHNLRVVLNGNWWIDLYLLDQIVSKVLRRNEDEIKLWRFHRRALGDEAQHQFTIFFYVHDDLGKKIQKQIANLRLMDGLEQYGILFEQAVMTKDCMWSTSDPSWPLAVQESWQYFIDGACKAFIILLDLAKEVNNANLSREDYYRNVDDTMSKLWYENGHHAFVHHISALFHGDWCKVTSQMEMIVRY